MAKKKPTKAQGELSGIERPTIPEMDELCAAQLKAQKASQKATEKFSAAKAATKLYMESNETKFDKDADKNRVHVYRDGEEQKVFKLRKGIDLVVTNNKKPPTDEPGGDIG